MGSDYICKHKVTENDNIIQYPCLDQSAVPEDIHAKVLNALYEIDRIIIDGENTLPKRLKWKLHVDFFRSVVDKWMEYNRFERAKIIELRNELFEQLVGKWWLVTNVEPKPGTEVGIIGAFYAYEYDQNLVLSELEQRLGDDYAVHLATVHKHTNDDSRQEEGLYYIQTTPAFFKDIAMVQVNNVINSRLAKVEARRGLKDNDQPLTVCPIKPIGCPEE